MTSQGSLLWLSNMFSYTGHALISLCCDGQVSMSTDLVSLESILSLTYLFLNRINLLTKHTLLK